MASKENNEKAPADDQDNPNGGEQEKMLKKQAEMDGDGKAQMDAESGQAAKVNYGWISCKKLSEFLAESWQLQRGQNGLDWRRGVGTVQEGPILTGNEVISAFENA
jgi:hypothetical protein